MAVLTKDGLSRVKPKTQLVPLVTSPDDSVLIRVISGRDRDRFFSLVDASKDAEDNHEKYGEAKRHLVVSSLANEDGSRMYAEGDTDAMMSLPCADLDAIYNAALDLSCLTAKSIEDKAKN